MMGRCRERGRNNYLEGLNKNKYYNSDKSDFSLLKLARRLHQKCVVPCNGLNFQVCSCLDFCALKNPTSSLGCFSVFFVSWNIYAVNCQECRGESLGRSNFNLVSHVPFILMCSTESKDQHLRGEIIPMCALLSSFFLPRFNVLIVQKSCESHSPWREIREEV